MFLWIALSWSCLKLELALTNENQDRLRSQLKNISYSYIYSYDFSKQKNIRSKDEWKALTDLRRDDSIIITKPRLFTVLYFSVRSPQSHANSETGAIFVYIASATDDNR